MSRSFRVAVTTLPGWLDVARLLGPGEWVDEGAGPVAELEKAEAADLCARLRGVTIGGVVLEVTVWPSLPRAAVREGRTQEARRQRHRSVGFSHPRARCREGGRLGLTPESLALEFALRQPPQRVLDACCGCGGDTVAFARAGHQVVAVDTDLQRLDDAAHNVALYGVGHLTQLRHGNAEQVVGDQDADLLYLDPPWTDLGLLDRVCARWDRYRQVVLKVPAQFDPTSLPDFSVEAVFGDAPGDTQRVKFLRLTRLARATAPLLPTGHSDR